MPAKIDWNKAFQPLIKKYKNKKHPLEYKNLYQLTVMVILSAQSTDNIVNQIAPDLFKKFPDFKSIANASPELLMKEIHKVRNFRNKANWLIAIAKKINNEKNPPLTMAGLVALPGIGRKSANVIMREAKVKAEGVMVDLHVVRVAERLGITDSTDDPKKIEQDIMREVSPKDWGEVGMATSFLGREICRPSHPEHAQCPMSSVCKFYLSGASEKMTKAKAKEKIKAKAKKKTT